MPPSNGEVPAPLPLGVLGRTSTGSRRGQRAYIETKLPVDSPNGCRQCCGVEKMR